MISLTSQLPMRRTSYVEHDSNSSFSQAVLDTPLAANRFDPNRRPRHDLDNRCRLSEVNEQDRTTSSSQPIRLLLMEVIELAPSDKPVDRDNFRDSIADSHRPMFELLQQLIEELVPEAEVSFKWGTIAYDLNGSLFSLSTNKKHVNLYVLTVGLLAEYSEELTGIPQSKCVLRFSPDAEVPLDTLRKVMTDAVERKRAG